MQCIIKWNKLFWLQKTNITVQSAKSGAHYMLFEYFMSLNPNVVLFLMYTTLQDGIG